MSEEKVEAPIIPNDKAEAPAVETPKVAIDSQEPKSLMDEITTEEKEAQVVEEKRLLETPDEQLSDVDRVKKVDLVKANEARVRLEKENVVPEEYKFVVPKEFEGKVTIDEEYVKEVSAVMKEGGITQATATKLSGLAAKQIAKVTEQAARQQEANFNSFVEDLKKETIAELSKDGKDYKKELAFAAKSRDRLASPEFIDVLNKSGLANDKSVVKHFIEIGKAISEGRLVEGQAPGAGAVDPLAVMYPKTTKQ